MEDEFYLHSLPSYFSTGVYWEGVEIAADATRNMNAELKMAHFQQAPTPSRNSSTAYSGSTGPSCRSAAGTPIDFNVCAIM